MGAVITVKHLAVIPPTFFNVLAERGTRLLHFSQPSVWQQMNGLGVADLSLLQSDTQAMARQLNLRGFMRAQGAAARKLPLLKIESFNSIPEQNLFALAAVQAGAEGKRAQRDLAMLLGGDAGKVTQTRRARLAERLGRLASLPKTRIRMPSGTQHLLADSLEDLFKQTAELNTRLVEVGLCAYAPKGADLQFPNTPNLRIDREDALAGGGCVPTYVQRDLIESSADVSLGLSFSHLTALRQRGIAIIANLADSQCLPKTDVTTKGGAHYMVSNSPAAVESAFTQNAQETSRFNVLPVRRLLM